MKLGMIGLGTMGRNLVLNIAEHGFSVAGYDIDRAKVALLAKEAQDGQVAACASLKEFVAHLDKPRIAMLLVPAGGAVDAVIRSLLPHFEAGDILIDGGNSYFQDTEHRQQQLLKQGIHLIGMGISGGEEGARHGASMMPGGDRDAYEQIAPIFEAVAAQVQGEPCVTYIGPQASGHYVKMVHNGIEYGLMQLIAESYHLLKRGCGLTNPELQQTYQEWNEQELNSFLIEITAEIFNMIDPLTGKPLIDFILGEAEQKGTGMWTSQEAMELGIAVPTIDLAVAARNMTTDSVGYAEARAKYGNAYQTAPIDSASHFIQHLRQALRVAFILTYTQGFTLLYQASKQVGYSLQQESIARIWRGGCIIRSSMLEDFRRAFQKAPLLPSLLLDSDLVKVIKAGELALRSVVQEGVTRGIPVPAFSATLAYFDTCRSQWLPANLIQAQRDFFGAHSYQRIDRDGTFHTEWETMEEEHL